MWWVDPEAEKLKNRVVLDSGEHLQLKASYTSSLRPHTLVAWCWTVVRAVQTYICVYYIYAIYNVCTIYNMYNVYSIEDI